MDSASLRSERVGRDSDVHFQPPPDKSFWQKPVKKLSSGIDSIKALRKSIWESVKFKLSGFFRKIRGWWQTITGTSDPVGKADLLYREFLDKNLDQLIKQLEHDHPNMKNELPEFHATLKPLLQNSLANSKRIRDELNYAGERIAQNQKRVSKNIEPILSYSEEEEPTEALGKRIASYPSMNLDKDQIALQDNLPENLKYLSNLPGLMGPQNIFEASVKLGFKEYLETEGSLKSQIHAQKLVDFHWSNIVVLRHRLGEFSKLYRRQVFPNVNSDPNFESDKAEILHSIIYHESKLQLAYGHDKLKRGIVAIQEMDFHKIYMQKLKSPSSPIGYQLQLLKPLEYFRVNGYISEKEAMYEQFKISKGEKSLGILFQQSDIVVRDIRNQIELAVQLVQERNKIINTIHVTPHDLENLLKHSKIDSPFK